MRTLKIVSAAAAVILTAGAAFAAGGSGPDGPRGGQMWDRLDADGDGVVTLNELNESQREFFAAADANGDGAVSKDEMKAFHNSKRAAMAAERMGDANGDGAVDRKEYDAAAAARFDKLDTDKDGVISEEEITAGRRGHHGMRRDR